MNLQSILEKLPSQSRQTEQRMTALYKEMESVTNGFTKEPDVSHDGLARFFKPTAVKKSSISFAFFYMVKYYLTIIVEEMKEEGLMSSESLERVKSVKYQDFCESTDAVIDVFGSESDLIKKIDYVRKKYKDSNQDGATYVKALACLIWNGVPLSDISKIKKADVRSGTTFEIDGKNYEISNVCRNACLSLVDVKSYCLFPAQKALPVCESEYLFRSSTAEQAADLVLYNILSRFNAAAKVFNVVLSVKALSDCGKYESIYAEECATGDLTRAIGNVIAKSATPTSSAISKFKHKYNLWKNKFHNEKETIK